MEQLFANLGLGFTVALSFTNLFYCLMGVLLGTLIGVLPGIGPVATIAMLIFGLLLGLVGTDVNSGVARFNFGISELSDGIGFVSVAMGVFGFAEIIGNLEQTEEREIFTKKVTGLLPTWQDIKDVTPS